MKEKSGVGPVRHNNIDILPKREKCHEESNALGSFACFRCPGGQLRRSPGKGGSVIHLRIQACGFVKPHDSPMHFNYRQPFLGFMNLTIH